MITVLGANSLVGRYVLSGLSEKNVKTLAVTRKNFPEKASSEEWTSPQQLSESIKSEYLTVICVAHIWVLLEYLDLFRKAGVKKIVAISSTSRFTKTNSSDNDELILSKKLESSENEFKAFCNEHGIEWTILQPTLIYGDYSDKNITEIARFINRFGFFPLFGKANGLRQPIHARDVALATVKAAFSEKSAGNTYIISGGETLTYREMVARVFNALGRPVRTPTVPISIFKIAIALLRMIPRFKNWTTDMAIRMNRDLVFDNTPAKQDWDFAPAGFVLVPKDVGKTSSVDQQHV